MKPQLVTLRDLIVSATARDALRTGDRVHPLGTLEGPDAVDPVVAWTLLQNATDVALLDVRTDEERDEFGRIPGALEIEWCSADDGAVNRNFVETVRRQVDPGAMVFVICSSGRRSQDAARVLADSGYGKVASVDGGFDGDGGGRRIVAGGVRASDRPGGWKARGLPWSRGIA